MRTNSSMTAESGRRVAALLALVGTLSACGVVGIRDAPRDSSGRVTEEASADAFALKVGDCLQDPGALELREITAVPCDQPHDYEAYAATLLKGTDYPGQESVETTARGFCGREFQKFIGAAYDESTLNYRYFAPSETSWSSQSDREILCLVALGDGTKSSTSLKGSKK